MIWYVGNMLWYVGNMLWYVGNMFWYVGNMLWYVGNNICYVTLCYIYIYIYIYILLWHIETWKYMWEPSHTNAYHCVPPRTTAYHAYHEGTQMLFCRPGTLRYPRVRPCTVAYRPAILLMDPPCRGTFPFCSTPSSVPVGVFTCPLIFLGRCLYRCAISPLPHRLLP